MMHRRLTKKEAKDLEREVYNKGYKTSIAKDGSTFAVLVKGRRY